MDISVEDYEILEKLLVEHKLDIKKKKVIAAKKFKEAKKREAEFKSTITLNRVVDKMKSCEIDTYVLSNVDHFNEICFVGYEAIIQHYINTVKFGVMVYENVTLGFEVEPLYNRNDLSVRFVNDNDESQNCMLETLLSSKHNSGLLIQVNRQGFRHIKKVLKRLELEVDIIISHADIDDFPSHFKIKLDSDTEQVVPALKSIYI